MRKMLEAFNGSKGYAAVGLVGAALVLIFQLIGGVPWAGKEELREFKGDVGEQLKEIRQDVRSIREYLMGGSRR